MLVWMPSSSGGAGSATAHRVRRHRIDTTAPQSPPCATNRVVAEALHQLDPGLPDAPGSQPVVVGLPENP